MSKKKELLQEELHPFLNFPYRLEYKERNETRVCHFECEEHMKNHIKKYGLKKNKYKMHINETSTT